MNLLNVICVFLSVANRSNPLGIKHSSNMAFVSTRGSSSASFSQMIFTGFCEDGGILLPKTLKTYSKDQLWSFRDLTFSELCFEVLRHYCDDMPEEDLRLVVLGSHDSFGHSDVISVVPLESGVSIAELFFGPTHAFKDLAMQVLGRLVSFVLAKQNRHARCVVSTTGDTGPASIAALKGKKNVDIFVLFPLFPAISRTQEMQMIASEDSNVHVIGTKSSADDNDEAMRQLFKSAPKDVGLTTMNSINCARLLCGVAQFIFCYLKVAKSMDDQVVFSIPSGAFGNATACLLAKLVGVPCSILAPNNVNDTMHRLISTGAYSENAVIPSLAPAIDSQSPYNLERILFYLTDGDTARVCEWMRQVASTKKMVLPANLLNRLQSWYISDSISDVEIEETMRQTWQRNRYLVCPHTAVAISAAHRHPSLHHVVCLATAHPAKFSETVTRVCGRAPALPFGLRFVRKFDLQNVDYSSFPALTVSEGTSAADTLVVLKQQIDKTMKK